MLAIGDGSEEPEATEPAPQRRRPLGNGGTKDDGKKKEKPDAEEGTMPEGTTTEGAADSGACPCVSFGFPPLQLPGMQGNNQETPNAEVG